MSGKRAWLFIILFCPIVYAQTCGDGYCESGENLTICSNDCNFLKVQGDKIVDSFGNEVLLKGFHTKCYYDAPYRTYHAGIREYIYDHNDTLIPISEIVENGIDHYIRTYDIPSTYLEQLDYDIIKLLLSHNFNDVDIEHFDNLGLNVIRVQIRLWQIEKQPFEYSNVTLEQLDSYIETLGDNGIYSIIDLHEAGQNGLSHNTAYGLRLWDNTDQLRDRTIALWALLAERYKDNAYVAGFDLINEPWAPDRQALHDYYQDLIDAIRETGDNHILFLEIDQQNKDAHQIGGTYTDNNYAASFHFYQPSRVTSKFNVYPGTHWYSHLGQTVYWNRTLIATEYDRLLGFEDFNDLPIFVGEFGAKINATEDNIDSVHNWLRDVMSVMNERDIHFTYHLYKRFAPNSPGYIIPVQSNWVPLHTLSHKMIFNPSFRLDDITEENRTMLDSTNFIVQTGLTQIMQDAFHTVTCGDGTCDPSENCSVCPQDCTQLHPSDNNPCNGKITTMELFAYIDLWKAGEVTMGDMMQAISLWKG